MFVYLGAALLLLVVMAWFVLSPFLVPANATRAAARPPVVTPPRSVARTATAPAVAAAATSAAPARAAAPAKPSTTVPADDDLHARVEAAIAARKAAMVRHSCDGCGASVDPGDAFCRACGTRV